MFLAHEHVLNIRQLYDRLLTSYALNWSRVKVAVTYVTGRGYIDIWIDNQKFHDDKQCLLYSLVGFGIK